MSDAQVKTLGPGDLRAWVCVVIGTRPGIVMLSPVVRELRRRELPFFVLHTGQHYSYNMDRQFLQELGLPEPDHRVAGTETQHLHGAQTAEMLRGCEEVLLRERPALVLVNGDANTNLAAALAARKLHMQVAHIEAGERSLDWRMPEEHNRVLIDHMSEWLFTTNEKGRDNLLRDGVRGEVVVTGNPIVDAVHQNRLIARELRAGIHDELGLVPGRYAIATSHREENVDSPGVLADIVEAFEAVAQAIGDPVVFAAHPRTCKRLAEFGLLAAVEAAEGVRLVEPQGYLSFLRLLEDARLAITDSGGVQQESCVLRIPCVTLRTSTEWSETVTLGANVLAGTEPAAVVEAARAMVATSRVWGDPFGTGDAAMQIVDVVERVLSRSGAAAAGALRA